MATSTVPATVASSTTPLLVYDDLKEALDCSPSSTDPLRAWCPVTLWSGAGFAFPSAPTTYVGITIAVKTGTSARTAILNDATVCALSVGSGHIRLTTITPDNDNEKKTLATTAVAIADVLRDGTKGSIHVGADLAGFLSGLKTDLVTKGPSTSVSVGKPATYMATFPAEVVLVHGTIDAYVVLEHVNDGVWMNVFPVRPYAP